MTFFPTVNAQGIYKFNKLKYWCKITEHKFTPPPMPKMVIDRVDDVEVDNNMPDEFTFTKTAGRDIGYDRELMLGVPDPGSPAWLYDTEETRNNHPQFLM